MLNHTKAAILILAVLLAACGKSHVRPGHADADFDLASLRDGGVALEIDTAVTVTEFRRAYASAFGSGDSLASYLAHRLLDSLNLGNPLIPAQRSGGSSDESPPHLVRITNIAVGNATRELPKAIVPGYGENVKTPAGGGTSESCVVTFEVEVLEIATGTSRLAFSVTGTADVPLYAYKTALREAVNAAARRTVWHLRGDE
jgi:hypothetical protein